MTTMNYINPHSIFPPHLSPEFSDLELGNSESTSFTVAGYPKEAPAGKIFTFSEGQFQKAWTFWNILCPYFFGLHLFFRKKSDLPKPCAENFWANFVQAWSWGPIAVVRWLWRRSFIRPPMRAWSTCNLAPWQVLKRRNGSKGVKSAFRNTSCAIFKWHNLITEPFQLTVSHGSLEKKDTSQSFNSRPIGEFRYRSS